jgi:hypothetical protein
MTFEVLIVKMSMLVFWILMPCGLIGVPPKSYLPTSSHSITTQKTNIDNESVCM